MKHLLIGLVLSSWAATTMAAARSVTIMAYNVENFFDTEHDEGKEDFTYLPLSTKQNSTEIQAFCRAIPKKYYRNECFRLDWNEKVYQEKMKRVAEVISHYGQCGADVVALVEVENERVLRDLINGELKRCGYKYVSLVEGPDERGIDTAVISKFPISSQKIHNVNLDGISKTTRGILETNLTINGTTLAIFSNHWPSQANPTAARVKAAEVLVRATEASNADLIVSLGDFNTLDAEVPNAVNDIAARVYTDAKDMKNAFAPGAFTEGTHWFDGHWSFLDHILVAKKSLKNANIRFVEGSYSIMHESFLLGDRVWTDMNTRRNTTYHNVPIRFEHSTGEGYSDHLPSSIEFHLL